MPDWPARFSRYSRRLVPSAIRGLADLPTAPDTISFGPGQPDAGLFPLDAVRDSLARILAEPARGRNALQYGPSEGDPRLRDLIARYMGGKGVRCGRENVLLTNGAQQALHLVAALLIDEGATIAVQSPTYPGALQIFAARGAKMRALEESKADGARPALIYAMANFHNPTGRSLTLAERRELLALAARTDAIVVEDDPYEVLRYEGEPLPPLLALETDARTIDEARAVYLGTFSKSVVPGFRIGWVVGPHAIVAALAMMKQTEDLQAGALAQACLAELFEPVMARHAATLRAAYRARRDAIMAALADTRGNLFTWTVPEGGFFTWLTLPEGVDTAAMLPEAARNGVTYVPGAAFHHDGGGANRLRLSFSSTRPERIGEGVRRLAETIRAGSWG